MHKNHLEYIFYENKKNSFKSYRKYFFDLFGFIKNLTLNSFYQSMHDNTCKTFIIKIFEKKYIFFASSIIEMSFFYTSEFNFD
jgi:hypothetical protein